MKISIFIIFSLSLYSIIFSLRIHSNKAQITLSEEPKQENKTQVENKTQNSEVNQTAPANTTLNSTSNSTSTNTTTPQKNKYVLEFVTSSPYNITHVGQIIQYEGNTLANPDDYTSSSKNAFFTMSVLTINMFPTKDSTELLESINLQYISGTPHIILGSAKCLLFEDKKSYRNITLCAKSPEEAEMLIKAYEKFRKLRNTDWEPENPFEGRIVRGSCNGIKDPSGETYDYLETSKIFKQNLERRNMVVQDDVIDQGAVANIKNVEDRIKAERRMVPGTQPEINYEKYKETPLRGLKQKQNGRN